MTPNLQFVDKGKVIAEFPPVAFQGGTIWIDKESPFKNGDYIWKYNGIAQSIAPLRLDENNITWDQVDKSQWAKVIAQTSNLNLESIPVVRVEDEDDDFIHCEAATKHGYGDSVMGMTFEDGYVKGYKGVQSKGVYSEKQLEHACAIAHADGDKGDGYNMEDILASIHPKLVVDCETVSTGMVRLNQSTSGLTYSQQPITFKGEDGRTHFKIKTV